MRNLGNRRRDELATMAAQYYGDSYSIIKVPNGVDVRTPSGDPYVDIRLSSRVVVPYDRRSHAHSLGFVTKCQKWGFNFTLSNPNDY